MIELAISLINIYGGGRYNGFLLLRIGKDEKLRWKSGNYCFEIDEIYSEKQF